MAAVITLSAGTLPHPSCYATEQERLNAYVAAITATLTGGIQWQSSQGAPSDLTLYWLRLDVSNRPVEALKYSATDGAWVRFLDEVIFLGDATGTLGNYQSAPVPQFLTSATAYAYGRMYVFKAPHTNTGPATLNINLLGSRPITRAGAVALVAGDIVVEQMVIVVFDGTNFQMLNPSAQTTVSVANIAPGTDRQFIRTNSSLVSVWETSTYGTSSLLLQALPAAGSLKNFPHLLTSNPNGAGGFIQCITPQFGYEVGDRVPWSALQYQVGSDEIYSVSDCWDSTNVTLIRPGDAGALELNGKLGGGAITDAFWKCGAWAFS
jgi:hypothetical protein